MRQPPRFGLIADRREIIDRRALTERFQALDDDDLQASATELLRQALELGREEIARRFAAEPGRGRVIAASYCFLADQLVRMAFDLSPPASSRGRRRRIAGWRWSGSAGPAGARWLPSATLT